MLKISDLFYVKYGVNFELSNLELDPNGINFVSRTEKNNGVSAKVKAIPCVEPNPKNTISVACSGSSILSSFFQEEPYYSGFHLLYLQPKQKFSINILLYYCMCIQVNKFKYSYGRQANKTLKDILIPSPDEIPAWVENIKIPKIPKVNPIINKKIDLNAKRWKYFRLIHLFDITGSKTTPIKDLEKYRTGRYPYVTTKATNNGIEDFYNFFTENEGVLTIDSAVLGYCSYQEIPFSASDHVEKLIPKFKINRFIAIFLVTIMNLEQYRYNYGRKCSQTRLKKISIKLPVNENNQPDWSFVEDYIKSLPDSKNLEEIM